MSARASGGIDRGLAALDRGEYELAVRELDLAIGAVRGGASVLPLATRLPAPDLAVAYALRAIAHRAVTDIDQAAADYREAARLHSGVAPPDRAEDVKDLLGWSLGNATGFLNRGCAFHNEGDLESAISNYKEAIRLAPDLAPALLNRALAYAARDRNNPASPTWDERQGVSDCTRAQADLSRVLSLEPGDRIERLAQELLARLAAPRAKQIPPQRQ